MSRWTAEERVLRPLLPTSLFAPIYECEMSVRGLGAV